MSPLAAGFQAADKRAAADDKRAADENTRQMISIFQGIQDQLNAMGSARGGGSLAPPLTVEKTHPAAKAAVMEGSVGNNQDIPGSTPREESGGGAGRTKETSPLAAAMRPILVQEAATKKKTAAPGEKKTEEREEVKEAQTNKPLTRLREVAQQQGQSSGSAGLG